MKDSEKLQQVALYMGMGLLPPDDSRVQYANGAFVFCREDAEVARAAAKLYRLGKIDWILLTGGIGKDSGELSRASGSEAIHQRNLLVADHGVPCDVIRLETKAKNGAENSRFGIDTIVRLGLPHTRIILVVHPRSARRVYAVHTKIARDEKGFSGDYQVVCMHDPLCAENPLHRAELLNEFVRVADWPGKGWSDPQPDLPIELLAWAREQLIQ